jgi:guanylate kinase
MPVLMLLAAPSGAGKTTLCDGLMARFPDLKRVITCTTRPPRPGERDGVDYYFLDEAGFDARLDRGEFLEHAMVYGRSYGTLRASVSAHLAAGRDALLAIDVQGVASVVSSASAHPDLVDALFTVFLTPPTRGELEARLKGRGSDDAAAVARRLAEAESEIARWRTFDYLVVSGSREEDLAAAGSIYTAERLKSRRRSFKFSS